MAWGLAAAATISAIQARKNRKATAAANDENMDWNKNQYQYKVADMKKAGLHPSLAAGANHGHIASMPETSDYSGVANAVSSYADQRAQKGLQQKQEDLIDAQIENIHAQTNSINADTGIKGQGLAGVALQTDQQNPSQVLELEPNKQTYAQAMGEKGHKLDTDYAPMHSQQKIAEVYPRS